MPASIHEVVFLLVVEDLSDSRDKSLGRYIGKVQVVEVGKQDALEAPRFDSAGTENPGKRELSWVAFRH